MVSVTTRSSLMVLGRGVMVDVTVDVPPARVTVEVPLELMVTGAGVVVIGFVTVDVVVVAK
jgi:hypothetical protein